MLIGGIKAIPRSVWAQGIRQSFLERSRLVAGVVGHEVENDAQLTQQRDAGNQPAACRGLFPAP